MGDWHPHQSLLQLRQPPSAQPGGTHCTPASRNTPAQARMARTGALPFRFLTVSTLQDQSLAFFTTISSLSLTDFSGWVTAASL